MGLWRTMCVDLGLTGLGVTEELGGSGGGFVEVVIVAEELGRTLAAVPFLSCAVLAVPALNAAGPDIAAEYLPDIVRGDSVATVVLDQDQSAGEPRLLATQLAAGTWSLTGHVRAVIGLPADLLLVFAQARDGLRLFAVSGSASGLKLRPAPSLDLSRTYSDLVFDGTEARLLADVDSACSIQRLVRRRAAVALAGEMLGGAVACLDAATEYAKVRNQFGRPIGSFQAIKHRCADMVVDVEGMRSSTWYGAWAIAAGEPDASIAASTAKVWCSDAAKRVMASGLQVHGGIGFTWEHDLHLFMKRSQFAGLSYGDAAFHRNRVAEILRARLVSGVGVF